MYRSIPGLLAGVMLIGAASVADPPSSAAQEAGQPLTVELRLSGTAFQGPPEFALLADGETIGQGTITNAHDTGGAEAGEVTPELLAEHAQDFRFELPAGSDPQALEITFLNDFWGGPDQPQADRNLYVLSATIDGRRYGPDAFRIPEEGASWIGEEAIGLLTPVSAWLDRSEEGWWSETANGDADPAQTPE